MAGQQVNISRRRFLIGASAAGAGLSLGLHLPAGADEARPEGQTPEVNAWVVIEPDDTVIIRIARSEMGQGTLTGLAQLVAEELECDWSKVTTEYPTPGESLARGQVWGSFSTGGSQGIRGSQQYMREGGALARLLLIEAAAEAWGVPPEECSTAASVITHAPSGRTTTYGKVAAAAATLVPPVSVELKDPKDWTIAGKPVKRLDTQDKLTGKQVFGADLRLPGMLNAAIRACPVFGGTLAGFEADAVRDMPGVRAVVPVEDNAVAVVADTWWHAKTALDALPVTWDEGPNAGLTSAAIAEMLDEGLEAKEAFVGNRAGDIDAALAGRRQDGRGRLRLPLPEPRDHGADERHRALDPGALRGLVSDPERRGGAGGDRRGGRTADHPMRGLQDPSRRRLRPTRGLPRLCHAGGRHRQTDAGHAGQAAVDPRRGHAARRLSPDHAVPS